MSLSMVVHKQDVVNALAHALMAFGKRDFEGVRYNLEKAERCLSEYEQQELERRNMERLVSEAAAVEVWGENALEEAKKKALQCAAGGAMVKPQ